MRIRIAAFVLAAAAGLLSAQETKIKKIPLTKTSPASGVEMFDTYCAVCHGKDGKGGGPAAVALKTSPTDLTRLASRNSGKFPEDAVVVTLSGTSEVQAHGSQEM